jgi:hypothetical protein
VERDQPIGQGRPARLPGRCAIGIDRCWHLHPFGELFHPDPVGTKSQLPRRVNLFIIE